MHLLVHCCGCLKIFAKYTSTSVFSIQPDPEDLICGFNDSITGYRVVVTGMTSSGHEKFQTMDVGRNESCACTVPEGIEHNVSVAAMNVLGLGDAAHVGTYGKFCYMLTHTTVPKLLHGRESY